MADPPIGRPLAPNASAWERAILEAMVRAWPLDILAIARQSDPMTCDVWLLPFLAFDKGCTYFNDAWPLAKQRLYVRDLLVYKRLEGTALGVELYANLEGAYVIREETPPGRSFVGKARVDPAAILALMPQLRLYRYWPDDVPARRVGFVGRGWVGFSAATHGRARVLGRYPVLFEPRTGVETPLDVVSLDQASGKVILGRRGTRGAASMVGKAYVGRSLLGPPNRPEPIVFDTADPFLEHVVVSPPCRPQVAAAGARRFVGRSFIASSRPGLGSYDRLYLWDGSRIAPEAGVDGRKAFVGASRLGVPAYHQILTLAVPGFPAARPPTARFVGRANVFRRRPDRPLARVMAAIECARRPGDRILVKLSPFRPGSRPAPVPAIGDLA